MSETYQIQEERAEGALILRASGKFDRGAGEAVAATMEANPGTCVLNMASVEYISSTGVAFLAKLSAGKGLRIASPADCVRNTLSLAGVERIRHLPAIIVQGRYDVVCPPETAYALRRAWPEADFLMVDDAGHAATEPGTRSALIAATDDFLYRLG